jgi:hypothetical protein
LGDIAGTRQAPPLVQQTMPPLEPNRIRGLAQEGQAASSETPLFAELPNDYQEAIFIFRVVTKEAADGDAVEADTRPEAKPAGK